MKVLHPNKWWAIRGNHETREVNGNQVCPRILALAAASRCLPDRRNLFLCRPPFCFACVYFTCIPFADPLDFGCALWLQAHYQDGSFLTQCLATFGESEGMAVWEAVNVYFDTLPLAASIDGAVFCVHGGIPQELCEPGSSLDLIRQVKTPSPANDIRGSGGSCKGSAQSTRAQYPPI
jgi:hypothetical protein